jgi:hypothetical protein
MKPRRIFLSVLAVLVFSLAFSKLCAEEKKYELNTASDTKDILKEHTGKTVSIVLGSGGELEGVVVKVGDHLVHISKLIRNEYYDAVIRIDKINSVIFKVRDERIRTTK